MAEENTTINVEENVETAVPETNPEATPAAAPAPQKKAYLYQMILFFVELGLAVLSVVGLLTESFLLYIPVFGWVVGIVFDIMAIVGIVLGAVKKNKKAIDFGIAALLCAWLPYLLLIVFMVLF